MDAISRRVSGPELAALVGQEVGVSSWTLVDQPRIDAFADVTEDWQIIHVDPHRAKATPFGGTIAHGFLVLSLLPKMAYEATPKVEGIQVAVNYGFDKVRFLQPVRSGERVRGRFRLAEAKEKDSNRWLIRYGVTVEIEDGQRTALIADWLGLQIVAAG
jgi:acyl dehydratase